MAPSSFKTIQLLNPLNLAYFTRKVSQNFGFKFTLLLSSVYYGIKGVSYYYATRSLLPYANKVNMSGQNIQLNGTIARLPWSIKGFIGVISDSFALFGYEKKWYLIILSFLSSISCLILIFLPFDAMRNFVLLPGLLLFFVHMQGSAMDLLCEGKYVDKMRSVEKDKKDVVTYIWFCQTVGEAIPAFTVGPIADNIDVRYIFVIALPFTIQPLYFLFMNCMVDDNVPPHLANRINTNKWKKESKMMSLALIMGFLILGTVLLAVISDSFGRLIYGIIISIILVILAFVMMPSVIAKGNIYIFLIRMLYLNIEGALDQFYVLPTECSGGPNFNYTFYSTISAVAGTIFNFIGLYFFQLFVSKWNFRPAFWVTTVLRVIGSFFDIILVQRWNTKIGIPDSVIYLVGNAALLEVIYMMDFMPMNLLIARLCPREIETTMYAVLAGYMNFGASMASYIGIFITDLLSIDTQDSDGTPCNFTNLTYLILIGHFALPLLSVPMTFVLIPNAKPDDNILAFYEKIKSEKIAKTEVLK